MYICITVCILFHVNFCYKMWNWQLARGSLPRCGSFFLSLFAMLLRKKKKKCEIKKWNLNVCSNTHHLVIGLWNYQILLMYIILSLTQWGCLSGPRLSDINIFDKPLKQVQNFSCVSFISFSFPPSIDLFIHSKQSVKSILTSLSLIYHCYIIRQNYLFSKFIMYSSCYAIKILRQRSSTLHIFLPVLWCVSIYLN